MFAGKTTAAYMANITPAHHQSGRVTSPSAPAISDPCEAPGSEQRGLRARSQFVVGQTEALPCALPSATSPALRNSLLPQLRQNESAEAFSSSGDWLPAPRDIILFTGAGVRRRWRNAIF
jgi:hypothetical protein